MSRKLSRGVAVLAAVVLAGCGAAHTISQAVDPVAQAAETTAQAPGYRVQATITLGLPTGQETTTMTGLIDRADRVGVIHSRAAVLGRSINLTEEFKGLTFYMQAAGMPQLKAAAHGKPWIKFDMSQALGAAGLGALPTSGESDPSQFVDYLRAVRAATKRTGTAVVGGVKTTRYHVTVDLDRYKRLVAPDQRASVARSVSTLESAIGTHLLPMNVWIDAHRMVRRMSMAWNECISNQHLGFAMTMNMFDFGPVAKPTLPGAGQSFDITPLMRSAMSQVKLGCSTS